MAVGLLPEMAENVFQPLLKRLAKDNSDGGLSPNEIRELVSGCGVGATLLLDLIEGFRELLRGGMEKGKVQRLQRELLDVVAAIARDVYPRVHEIVAGAALPDNERE